MKTKLLFTSLLLSLCASAQTWSSTTVSPSTTGRIETVDLYSTNYALAGGYLGFNALRYKSFDGGQIWSSFSSNTNVEIYDFHVFSNNETIALTSGGDFKTSDGGNTFTQVTSHGAVKGRYSFVNNNIGWKVITNNSGSGYIYKTINGGLSFAQQIQANFNLGLYDVSCFNANNVWMIGEQGLINATTDGGNNWVSQTSGVTNNLNGVHFYSITNGVAVGDSGTILRTTNGGTTWALVVSNTTQNLNDVHFADTSKGWAVGNNGVVLNSNNGGLTWTSQASTTTQNLYEVDFLNPFVGIAGGANGTIIRFQENCTNTNSVNLTNCGPFLFGGVNRTASGQYIHTFLNQFGCDSTVTLNLTVLPISSSTITASSCGPYTHNGQTYTFTGTFTQTYTSTNGCDSTVTLNLTITPPQNPSIFINNNTQLSAITSSGFSYQWLNCNNGNSPISGANMSFYNVTASGSYAIEVGAVGACPADTSACVQVCTGINSSVALSGQTMTAAQAGATYQWVNVQNNNSPISGATAISYTATSNGVYAVLISLNGCTARSNDITICVIANTITLSGITLTATQTGMSYQWKDCNNSQQPIAGATNRTFTPTVSGDYYVEIYDNTCRVNSNCITVNVCAGLSTNISVSGQTITAAQAGASYQWIDCNNLNTPISGATNQSYTPTASGNYSVRITFNGCTATSVCSNIVVGNTSGIAELELFDFSIFPNPANSYFQIKGIDKEVDIVIFDLTGKQLLNTKFLSNNQLINLSEFTPGVYMIRVVDNDKIIGTKKLIVNR